MKKKLDTEYHGDSRPMTSVNDIKSDFIKSRKIRQSYNSYSLGFLGNIFKFIIILFCVVCLVRIALGRFYVPSFTELLTQIHNAPRVNIPYTNFSFTSINPESAFLTFFANIANAFARIIDVVIFFINGLTTALSYVTYIFRWIFVV